MGMQEKSVLAAVEVLERAIADAITDFCRGDLERAVLDALTAFRGSLGLPRSVSNTNDISAWQPIWFAPAGDAPSSQPGASSVVLSLHDFISRVQKYPTARVVAIKKQFGVSTFSRLAPEKYQEVLDALEKLK